MPVKPLSPELNQLIDTLPKTELHIHLEGALEPELMFELAAKNSVDLPYDDVEAIRRAYDFSNLQDFLDLYFAGTSVLQTADDFCALGDHYFSAVAKDGAVRAECFFDPQAHSERGVDFATVFEGFNSAAEKARAGGLEVGFIVCFLRHLSEKEAFDVLAAMEPFREHIIGVGLDSSELGHPPTKFKRVFAAARDAGLRLVAHAGEEGPPEYVWQALDELGVDRIDHGNRALEDQALVARLQRDQIPLTVCPLSNLKLCVVDDLTAHPLRKMLDAGLLATIHSDDPAYFGGYLNDNYRAIAAALEFSDSEIRTLASHSLDAAFR